MTMISLQKRYLVAGPKTEFDFIFVTSTTDKNTYHLCLRNCCGVQIKILIADNVS